jgi:two-component system, NtrC family, sensor kinase
VEFRFRHADGSWRHLEAVGNSLLEDPNVRGVVLNSRDITERKQAEKGLRFQKALLEAQTEASIDGILVVSADGEMISFNQRFVEMWGIPKEVIGTRSDNAALQSVVDKLIDPQEFLARVAYLYEHPNEESRDEILLKDGRTFDRYSAPVRS